MTEITQEQQKKFMDNASNATFFYTIPVFYPENPFDPEIGSGTLAIIGGMKGVITNDHVADFFKLKKHTYIYTMHPNTTRLDLRFKSIIALPHKEGGDDVDLAFIVLDINACNALISIGKQFWDLDKSFSEYSPSILDATSSVWLIHGNVDEGKKTINDPNVEGREILFYEMAGAYFAAPNLNNIERTVCNYGALKFDIDLINCPRDTKFNYLLPRSFLGMSGGALWKVKLSLEGDIQKIDFVGIATEQRPKIDPHDNNKRKQAKKIICRGPITLYESFYPFCLKELKKFQD